MKILSDYINNLVLNLNIKPLVMGKAKNGVYGPITGKLSNLVWFRRYGQDYVRTKGVRTAPLSALQKANCSDMAVLMAFFKNIKPFIKAGFGNLAMGTTLNYHNIATALNKTNAIQSPDGKAEVDFAAVLLSAGDALEVRDPAVQLLDNGLEFTWNYDAIADWASRKDQTMLMAYFPESNEATFVCSGARRADGKDVLELHSSYLNKRMEVYIAFTTDERTDVSRSVYLGRIN
jgi:hypothetical protein